MFAVMHETALQKNIKDRLDKKNMSIAELERRAGLRHAVINILHGRSKNPGIHAAQAIAKELGCSMEDLLSEENQNSLVNSGIVTTLCNRQQWDQLLAIKTLEVLNKYLIENNLNPDPTEIFKCADEIYKYAANNPEKLIDPVFVAWITERFFVRHLR